MDSKEIVRILEEIAVLLELQGENPFKARAYSNAARTLETMSEDPVECIRSGQIESVKGIGEALSKKLTILVNEGKLPYYENLKASFPAGLFELLEIQGLGPKKLKVIYEKLGVVSIGELEYACLENRLRDLPGFGQKNQDKIFQAIQLRKHYRERFHFHVAEEELAKIMDYLRRQPSILRLELAGSLRRRKETIKDLDLVACCRQADREAIMSWFIACPERREILGQGDTKSAIILSSGMSCDLRLVEEREFPFALHHSTGSKEHNTAMRQRAKKMNLTMNEYGLFPANSNESLACTDEAAIFHALNLDYIPPELREDQGEIEAAEKKMLPDLVAADQIKGVFHVHSTYSDGSASIRELAQRCRELGLHYLGISDHSKSAFYANGLIESRIKLQHDEIDQLNLESPDFYIFKGIEADILPGGELDYADDVLASFDFVIASVHSSFQLSEAQMTERICRALQNPFVTMLGHPTGRLLLGREPYAVNMSRIIETAAKFGKIIEINANPHRLDLDWRWGKFANALGVRTAINPDAHSLDGLADYIYGIGIARKGWFRAEQVINTFDADRIKQEFRKVIS